MLVSPQVKSVGLRSRQYQLFVWMVRSGSPRATRRRLVTFDAVKAGRQCARLHLGRSMAMPRLAKVYAAFAG